VGDVFHDILHTFSALEAGVHNFTPIFRTSPLFSMGQITLLLFLPTSQLYQPAQPAPAKPTSIYKKSGEPTLCTFQSMPTRYSGSTVKIPARQHLLQTRYPLNTRRYRHDTRCLLRLVPGKSNTTSRRSWGLLVHFLIDTRTILRQY
jgi:hypothetical protein